MCGGDDDHLINYRQAHKVQQTQKYFSYLKANSILSHVISIWYVTCYSLSSIKHIKSPIISISWKCQRTEIKLEIRKKAPVSKVINKSIIYNPLKYLTNNRMKTYSLLYVVIMSHMTFRVNPHSEYCLSIKELHPQNRHDNWSLSDFSEACQMIELCCEYLTVYSAFDCMFLLCHLHLLEWIHTL